MTVEAHRNPFSEWGRFFLAYAMLNAPYWLLGQWFYLSRPLFNVELVIPLLLCVWSIPAGVLALIVFWVLDLTVSQALSYHFTSPLEFLRSVQFLSDVHVERFLSADRILTALLFIVSAAAAIRWSPRLRAAWLPALGVVTLVSVLDITNGSSMFWQRGTRIIATNIADSPTLTLGLRAWKELQPTTLGPIPQRSSATSIADLADWATSHPDGSMLIVIVESFGWHNDAGMRRWLHEQLINESIATNYQIEETRVPFRGSTTSAELRELCGLYGSYRSLGANEGQKCLPARLALQGWKTTGLHGFSSHMFRRTEWWPLIGLETRHFAQDLLTSPRDLCGGAFAGVCDTALLEAAVSEASLPRHMVYALTLNSHLPLQRIDVPVELQQRCDASSAGRDVCQLTATLGVALRALRDALIRSGASPAIVLVGDHAPPFVTLNDRTQYDATQVPAFILKPKPHSATTQ
ncbi:MAG: hypothetical protein ABI781_00615 [Burkholderiales bacterium]